MSVVINVCVINVVQSIYTWSKVSQDQTWQLPSVWLSWSFPENDDSCYNKIDDGGDGQDGGDGDYTWQGTQGCGGSFFIKQKIITLSETDVAA